MTSSTSNPTTGHTNCGCSINLTATTVTAPDSGTTTYTYDQVGNLATRTDANQHTTTYGYDEIGQLTSITDPLQRTTSYTYDPDGNQNKTVNARGVATTITYDALDRATVTDYSDNTPDVTVRYDAAGNRREITDGTGTRNLTYNEANQLKTVTVPGTSGGFTYEYSARGMLSSRTLPHGRTTTYTYDVDRNRIAATTDGAVTTYGYDPAGNLTSTKPPAANGYTESRSYNPAGQLTDITSTKDGTTLSAWHATLDRADQPTRIDSERKGVTESTYYTYDSSGRLATECTSPVQAETCPTGTPTTTYTYDRVGNRTSSTTPDGTATAYSHDAADQLTRTSTGDTVTGYEYDADGNQIKVGNRTYDYDAENRLTSMTASGTTWGYVYDADGNRAKRTRGGLTLAWDINNDLPQLAAEYSSSGAVSADYTYNPLEEIESQHRTVSGNDTAYYYHRDLSGSVTDLTNATGGHAKTYDYTSAFGTGGPRPGAAQPSNNFGYAGQYKEPAGGEDPSLNDALGYNLRARTYDPANGRFTSKDPVTPGESTPYESTYAYTGNAPTYRTDPAGTCWWSSSSTTCLASMDVAMIAAIKGVDQNCAAQLRANALAIQLAGPSIGQAGGGWGSVIRGLKGGLKKGPWLAVGGAALDLVQGNNPLDSLGVKQQIDVNKIKCSIMSREERHNYQPLIGGAPTGVTALLCPSDLKPVGARGNARKGTWDPPGFVSRKGRDRKYIFNRSHILGDRFHGKWVRENIFTGFREMNKSAMKKCENRMADQLGQGRWVAYSGQLAYGNGRENIPTSIAMTAITRAGGLFSRSIVNRPGEQASCPN